MMICDGNPCINSLSLFCICRGTEEASAVIRQKLAMETYNDTVNDEACRAKNCKWRQ